MKLINGDKRPKVVMHKRTGYGIKLSINQVRMDAAGNIGICIGITLDSIMLQRSERQIEFIPIKDLKIFQATTWSLGIL